MTSPSVTHRPGKDASSGTFELRSNGKSVGHLSYSLPDAATMTVDYVEVSPTLRGKGMGERLVNAAVAWALENKRQVVPLCSYARAVMSRKNAKKTTT
jgi:predicted GNAT family acetyltransferase